MSNICDFDRTLKTECNLQHFTRNCRIKNLNDFERDEANVYCGERRERNDHMLQSHCTDDQDKIQSVTDTDNEFTECQTPRKKLQSIGISPVSLHAFMKTLKSNILEA